jgi:chromosome segregation ATPase
MSRLEEAERRLGYALARLEDAVNARPQVTSLEESRAEFVGDRPDLESECQTLRAECDRLRRAHAELEERHKTLMAVASRAGNQLDSAIGEINDLLET